MKLELNINQSDKEILEQLKKIDLPADLFEFVSTAFRLRIKIREDGTKALQIRIWPPLNQEQELDLEEWRIILQQKIRLELPEITLVVLEYKECCMEGCSNCNNFIEQTA
jgi:hypothetical protein